MIVKNNKEKYRTKLGTMQTLIVQAPQTFDDSSNKDLVGIYVKAAAANSETVLITNANSSPSHYTYWPDNLKVAAGTTKFFEHTGDIVKFALEAGAESQLIKIVPVYRV